VDVRKYLLALLVAIVATGCNWPQFHGDAARTGFQPIESKIGASTVASLSEVWTASIGLSASSPVVVGGRVYIGNGSAGNNRGSVDVFDAAGQTNCSGTPKVCHPLWSATTIVGVTSTPAVVNGFVYVVDELGGLYAFDAAGPSHCTGAPNCPLLWSADTGAGFGGSPAVSGGVVYVGTADRLSAYDAAGTTNCSLTPSGFQFCEPLWTASTGSPISASVAVAGGVVYASSQDGTLYAYDAAGQANCTGTPKLCQPLWIASANAVTGYSPVVGGGSVYTIDGSRRLEVFDAAGATNCSGRPKTCRPLWTARLPPSTGDSSADTPALANGRVYVGTAVYDARGVTNCWGRPTVCAPLWRTSGGGRLPVVANGIEFAGGSVPTGGGPPLPLDAFDATGTSNCSGAPTTCTPLWTVDPGGPIFGSPAVVNGVLYVATSGDPASGTPGTLHAYALG
jgi:PQQ-like domain